jgi:hypothetical protein
MRRRIGDGFVEARHDGTAARRSIRLSIVDTPTGVESEPNGLTPLGSATAEVPPRPDRMAPGGRADGGLVAMCSKEGRKAILAGIDEPPDGSSFALPWNSRRVLDMLVAEQPPRIC